MGQRIAVAGAEHVAPISQISHPCGGDPDANVYGVALLLSLVSGFLFGAVPVRQVLRTNPYEVIKRGASGTVGRRITVRDLLLATQNCDLCCAGDFLNGRRAWTGTVAAQQIRF